MKKRIKDIASVNTGLYQKVTPTGEVQYLQAKDFDELGRFHRYSNNDFRIHWNHRFEKHLLRDGDILFIAKGRNNKACLYEAEIGEAVASSVFFVIRPKVEYILPEYFQWYLNTPYMQKIFSRFSTGTQIHSISKKTIGMTEISIPTLRQQRSILQGQYLWEKEKSLMQRLIEKKELFYQKLLFNATKSTI